MAMPFLDFQAKKKTKKKEAVYEVEHLLRQGAYASRKDLVWQTTFRLPEWADGKASTFFEASEMNEREGGTWGFVLWCSIPRGLAHDAEIALGERFIAAMFSAYAGLAVLHEPLAADGHLQPHFHLLLSARLLDEHDRPADQFFKRYNAAHPACGGARKDALLNARHYPSLLHNTWDTMRTDALRGNAVDIPADSVDDEAPVAPVVEELTLIQKFMRRSYSISQGNTSPQPGKDVYAPRY